MNDTTDSHPSAELLQAFLEGQLSRRKLGAVEEHLAGCPRCSGELDAWRALFHDLGGLARHGPREGFAERVMTDPRRKSHVPEAVLQDFLEGSLGARSAERVARHLTGCASCAAEADAWTGVFRRLDQLEAFTPGEGFADRVISGVQLPDPVSLAARIRARVASLFGSPLRGLGASAPEHVPAGILQDFVDGALPETAVARVEAHVEACGRCANELDSWRLVAARLGSLGSFEPAEGFEDQVMAGLRVARATRPLPAREPAWARGLRAARSGLRRLVPETRQAVAVLSGAAVTPMVVVGLVFWALASHPALTMSSLVSFAWWQVSDLVTAAVAAASTVAFQSAEMFGLYSLLETLASAPTVVAGGVLVYTTVCALALRVLYKNLFANRPTGGRHTHVQTAS